jgi:hypothetical protein
MVETKLDFSGRLLAGINEDLKKNIFTKFPKEEDEEDEENFFFKNVRENRWKTVAFLGVILIFAFVSFISENFFSGRTLVSFLIFLIFVIFMGVISRYIKGSKSVFIGIGVLIGGMWVANLYYWGFNQYIIQRTLAAKSLEESQKRIGSKTVGKALFVYKNDINKQFQKRFKPKDKSVSPSSRSRSNSKPRLRSPKNNGDSNGI